MSYGKQKPLQIVCFSSKPYDETHFKASHCQHQIRFISEQLSQETVTQVQTAEVVCVFVNDRLDAAVLQALAEKDVRLVTLRCAGFDNVDVAAAQSLGISIARVPDYSPAAVAEHAVCLLLALNRKVREADKRVHAGDFSLDGLLGFDVAGKTIGVVGTGKIGTHFAKILLGMQAKVLASDPLPCPECEALGVEYVSFAELLSVADVVSLHCPLNTDTRYMFNKQTLALMKPGAMLINTSRGALIDTKAVLAVLQSGQLGMLGMDVYEFERGVFFEDCSESGYADPLLEALLGLPNVLATAHQAFFTAEAVQAIVVSTVESIDLFAAGKPIPPYRLVC